MKCNNCGCDFDKINYYCSNCGAQLNINDFSKKVICMMSNEDFYLSESKLSEIDIILLCMISALNEEKEYNDFLNKNNLTNIKISYDINSYKIKNYYILEKYVGDLTCSPIEIFYNFILKNKVEVSKEFGFIPGISTSFDDFYNNLYNTCNISIDNTTTNQTNEITSAKDYVTLYRAIDNKISPYINKNLLIDEYVHTLTVYTLFIGHKYYNFNSKYYDYYVKNNVTLDTLVGILRIPQKLVDRLILKDNKVIPLNQLKLRAHKMDFFDSFSPFDISLDELLSKIIVPKGAMIEDLDIVISESPYDNLSIKTTEFIEDIMRIYDKLLKKRNYNRVIKDKSDLIQLSILLASFKNDNYLRKFYYDNEIYLSNVLKILALDEDFLSDINTYEIKDDYFKLFNKYINQSYETTEDDIIKELINALPNNNLIARIYSMHTGINVNGNFNKYIDIFYNKKRIESQKDLLEQYKNVNSEIYYLLGYACSYHKKLGYYKGNKLSDEEKAAFSLLFSLRYMVASKYPYLSLGAEIVKSDSGNYVSATNGKSSLKPGYFIYNLDLQPYDYRVLYEIMKGDIKKDSILIYYHYKSTAESNKTISLDIDYVNKIRYESGINSFNILEYLDIEKKLYDSLDLSLYGSNVASVVDFDVDLIDKYYKSFVDLNDKNISLCNVIEKVLSSKLVSVEDCYKTTYVHDIKNLNKEVQDYINRKIEELRNNDFKKIKDNYNLEEKDESIIKYSTKVLGYLNGVFKPENKSNIIDASILISFLLSNNTAIKYFEKAHITISNILKYINIDENDFRNKINEIPENMCLFDDDYFNKLIIYCEFGSNFTFDYEIPDDNWFAFIILMKNNLLDSYITHNSINKGNLLEEIEYDKETPLLILDSFEIDEEEESIVKYSTKVLKYLNNKSNLKNIKENDKVDASILISFFISNNNAIKYFEKYGINISNIFNFFNIDEKDFREKIDEISEDIYLIDDKYKKCLQRYSDSEGENYNVDSIYGDNEFAYQLLEGNPLLRNYIKENDVKEEDLLYEVVNNREKEIILTKEEIIENLRNNKDYENIPDNIIDMLTYGDSLSKYTNMIVNEYKELLNSNTMDKVLDDLKNSINKIYVITPAVIKENKSIFKKEDVIIEKEKRSINVDVLKEVEFKIEEYIKTLNEELKSFNYINIYYEVYLEKLDSYINRVQEKINETAKENDLIDLLNSKLNSFMASKSIAKTEQIKTLECIKNHYVLVQNLIVTRNNLLSFLTNEVAFSHIKNNENNAFQISDSIAKIISEVIIQNNSVNLDKLRELNIPSNIIDELNTYLNSQMKLTKGGNNNGGNN